MARFLDPIADKLLVAAVLMMLVAIGGVSGLVILPALVILCREILVSGLREYLAEIRVPMPVSKLAKWKTTIQMVALGVLVVGVVLLHFGSARAVARAGLADLQAVDGINRSVAQKIYQHFQASN